MNKLEYIQQPEVKSFIEWTGARLDAPGVFVHSYTMKRPKGVSWNCNSIYNAFEQYQWPFTCSHPLTGSKVTGRTFQESHELLSELAEGLKSSVVNGDAEDCRKYSFAILDWGGVLPRNNKK